MDWDGVRDRTRIYPHFHLPTTCLTWFLPPVSGWPPYLQYLRGRLPWHSIYPHCHLVPTCLWSTTPGICMATLPLLSAWPPPTYAHCHAWATCFWWPLSFVSTPLRRPLVSAWPSFLRFPSISICSSRRLASGGACPWCLHGLPTSAICMASLPWPPRMSQMSCFLLLMISYSGRFPKQFSTLSRAQHIILYRGQPHKRGSTMKGTQKCGAVASKDPKRVV